MYYFDGKTLSVCLNKIRQSYTVDTLGAVYFINNDLEFVKVLLPEAIFNVYDRKKDLNDKGPEPGEFTDVQFMIDDPTNVKWFRTFVKKLIHAKYPDASQEYFRKAQ